MLIKFDEVKQTKRFLRKTGINFIDEKLGGGIPDGTVLMLYGSPASGKSTLCSQIVSSYSERGDSVLYMSGEEGVGRVKSRIQRVGSDFSGHIDFYRSQNNYIEDILPLVDSGGYKLLVIDSLAKLKSKTSNGVNLTIINAVKQLYYHTQLKNCFSVIVIAQSNKKGGYTGSRQIGHEVDIIVNLQKNEIDDIRMIELEKNREGERGIGYALMTPEGLEELAIGELNADISPLEKPGWFENQSDKIQFFISLFVVLFFLSLMA